MRIVVTGATGNVGTSVLEVLARDPEVEEVLGLARRVPEISYPKTTFAAADVTKADLAAHFRGADVLIHLAWLIQPSRDRRTTRAVNVDGTARVLRAAADAGVPAIVHASSVGAYSPGPKDRAVTETWPTGGIPTSFYSRDKVDTERLLDRFEEEHPGVRVVRLRPALIFKREAGSEIRRLFAGPFLPSPLLRRGLIPVVPRTKGLRFQAVHSLDVGEAYRLAATRDVRGAFNLAADPVLDTEVLGRILDARPVPVPAGGLRAGAWLTWKLRLQPTPPGWVDMGLNVPLLDSTRAREELGWTPVHRADETLLELLDGMRERAGLATPPLAPAAGGRLRWRELATGVGGQAR